MNWSWIIPITQTISVLFFQSGHFHFANFLIPSAWLAVATRRLRFLLWIWAYFICHFFSIVPTFGGRKSISDFCVNLAMFSLPLFVFYLAVLRRLQVVFPLFVWNWLNFIYIYFYLVVRLSAAASRFQFLWSIWLSLLIFWFHLSDLQWSQVVLTFFVWSWL